MHVVRTTYYEVNQMSILIFDIPRGEKTLSVRVFRALSKNAELVQFSVWKSSDVDFLMKIAIEIKKSGGSARILEERFIF